MKRSIQTRGRISKGLKKDWKRPARKRLASKIMKEVWSRPGMHDRWSQSMKRAHRRPEVKRRHVRAIRKRMRQPGMFEFLSRVQRRHEKKVIKSLKKQGYELIRHGWPDLIAIKKNKIRFIEAKGPTGKLSVIQKRMHAVLQKIGIIVEVLHA